MGTNFYFKVDNKKKIMKAVNAHNYSVAKQLMDKEFLHIAKTSAGWLPLFQAHLGLFRSVAEMKTFYETNDVTIVDEYETEYNWDAFDDRVLKFNGGVDGAIPKTYPNIDKTAPFYDKDMPDWIPISHFDYGNGKYSSYYFKDPEGYEFDIRDFC